MSDVHTVQRAIEGLPSIADMPAEIRFQIYDLMNAPRFVELRYDELLTTFWTPTMVPVGLQVCRESRRETQSHYVKRFAGRDGEANIWFDFSYDTLYFSKSLTSILHPLSDYTRHRSVLPGRTSKLTRYRHVQPPRT